MNFKQIKWNQPKYVLPGIVFPLLLIVGWFVISIFTTPLEDNEPSNLKTTHYLSDALPEAQYRGDGIGDRRQQMENAYGRITDYTAVTGVEEEAGIEKPLYESQYSEEDRALLEAAERDAQAFLDQQIAAEAARQAEAAAKSQSAVDIAMLSPEELAAYADSVRASQDAELQAAIAAAQDEGQAAAAEYMRNLEIEAAAEAALMEQAVTAPDEDAPVETVVKVQMPSAAVFHTIADNGKAPNLIKAIIDEDIVATDGSRVRLRLLDDIALGGEIIRKGTYLYATVSGFGSQRVRGKVSSVLVGDDIVKIDLSVYDMDGLEGLYVPRSDFRETMKQIAGTSLNGGSTIISSGQSAASQFAQWGVQAAQQGVSAITQALSKNARQNRAKLKYGSQVYLVNGAGRQNR